MSSGTGRWSSHWALSNINRIQQFYLVNKRRNKRRKCRMGYRTKYFIDGKFPMLDPQNRWWPTEILWACPLKTNHCWSHEGSLECPMNKIYGQMLFHYGNLKQISDQFKHWYCKHVVFSKQFWNWIKPINEVIWDFCIWQQFPLQ